MSRMAVLAVVIALYLLHFDFWLWQRPEVVLGLPLGLWYQLIYCLLVSGVLALLLRSSWNPHRDPASSAPLER